MSRTKRRHLLCVLATSIVISSILIGGAVGIAAAETGEIGGAIDSDASTLSSTGSGQNQSLETESRANDPATEVDSSPAENDGGKRTDVRRGQELLSGHESGTTARSDRNATSTLREGRHRDTTGTMRDAARRSIGPDDLVVFSGQISLPRPGLAAPGTLETVDDAPEERGEPSAVPTTGMKAQGDPLTGGEADDDEDERAHSIQSSNNGGHPAPSEPPMGTAVGLGALAAVAAIRATPIVGGVSVPMVGSLGSAVLPSLLERLRPFLFPLRYSQYDNSDPLEHETRERIYEIVNDTPGTYLSEVAERADLGLSTARHHVKVLEREDLISSAKLRGKLRFYPAYAEDVELAAALDDDSTATIIDALARLGRASVSDLADELDRDPSTISYHLQRLDEDDIITREREGTTVFNKLAAEARTAIEPDANREADEATEALAGGAD